jgi:hypothetical protein
MDEYLRLKLGLAIRRARVTHLRAPVYLRPLRTIPQYRGLCISDSDKSLHPERKPFSARQTLPRSAIISQCAVAIASRGGNNLSKSISAVSQAKTTGLRVTTLLDSARADHQAESERTSTGIVDGALGFDPLVGKRPIGRRTND